MTPVRYTPRPWISTYGYLAYQVALLQALPAAHEWILSNYIQIAYKAGADANLPITFFTEASYNSPWLAVSRLEADFLNDNAMSARTFVEYASSTGRAVQLDVDLSLLTDGELTEPHDALIVHLDNGSDHVSIATLLGWWPAGPPYRRHLQFGELHVPLPRVIEAFLRCPPRWVMSVGVNEHTCYPMDLDLIDRTYREYLEGLDTSRHFASSMPPEPLLMYGLPGLREFAQDVCDEPNEEQPFGRQNFQILSEHRRLAHLRCVKLFGVNDPLVARSSQFATQAELLNLRYAKHSMTKNVDGVRRCGQLLLEQLSDEKMFISDFLSRLTDIRLGDPMRG